MTTVAAASTEYERRIIHGIPVNVTKGATKTGIADLYSWNETPTKFGQYNYATNQLTIDDAAVGSLEPVAKAWRATQVARSRADLRHAR
jgi:hypothetical protein